MAEEPKLKKLCDCAQENRLMVIEVLKAGVIYSTLLSEFESGFIRDSAYRYGKYGDQMTISPDQLLVYVRMAKKLNLNVLFRPHVDG
jgi:hypothetical protein